MEFSSYQKAIFDWAEAHVEIGGALVVEAVAGSGKTTTVVEAANIIPADDKTKAIFLAFNRAIANELDRKLPDHVAGKTLNSLGWQLCMARLGKGLKLEKSKTFNLITRHLDDEAREVLSELITLIGKAKSHGLIPSGMPTPSGTYEATTERWLELMSRYDVDSNGIGDEQLIRYADEILKRGLDEQHELDFDDQLYMPVALDMGAWRYDWIIIDEAQDISHVQRTLLRKFLKSNGRLIAVGDTHQAIYGFRGADSQSMANMRRLFKADELPLSISYRCPRKVIEIAQQFVPHIQASDTAEDGEILYPETWDTASFSETDLVVCRNTAPLITLAYKCIADGHPVKVLGREIGIGLVNVIKKAGGRNAESMDVETFKPRLVRWTERMMRKAGDDESKQANVDDKADCINILMAGLDTVAELIKAINSIFSNGSAGVTLATVHKAKGLEAPRVFILEPSLMPSPWARQAWQQEQEANLQYVAVTRALETLVYLPLEIIG